jgi:hypothetical protein
LEHKHGKLLLVYKNNFNVFWDVGKCRQVRVIFFSSFILNTEALCSSEISTGRNFP